MNIKVSSVPTILIGLLALTAIAIHYIPQQPELDWERLTQDYPKPEPVGELPPCDEVYNSTLREVVSAHIINLEDGKVIAPAGMSQVMIRAKEVADNVVRLSRCK